MSEASLTNLVKSIEDSQPASISLKKTDGSEVRLECVYKESIAPSFFVVLPPGNIPDDIDLKQACNLSLEDDQAAPLALTAKIIDIPTDRSIELTATTALDPTSLREYFRINLQTAITISYEAAGGPGQSRNWSTTGQTLDISASGVLGLFPDEADSKNNITIEISLPNPEKKIICIGHVVRQRMIRGRRWHIALHFDNISQNNRDAIITNCLIEQRRQLRERIQTASNIL